MVTANTFSYKDLPSFGSTQKRGNFHSGVYIISHPSYEGMQFLGRNPTLENTINY